MSGRKKKLRQNGQVGHLDAASNGNGEAKVQRSLFETIGESQILLLLQELIMAMAERVEKLERLLTELLNQVLGGVPFEDKEYYTPKEFAQVVERKVETIRDHLKEGRLEGTRGQSGRGGIPEWRIPRDELHRYQSEGLRQPEFRYRHPK